MAVSVNFVAVVAVIVNISASLNVTTNNTNTNAANANTNTATGHWPELSTAGLPRRFMSLCTEGPCMSASSNPTRRSSIVAMATARLALASREQGRAGQGTSSVPCMLPVGPSRKTTPRQACVAYTQSLVIVC